MKPSNKSGLKKKAAALVALLAMLATAVGGTFAYKDYKQHKSNEFNGLGKKYEARLVEDFKEIPDWKVEDGDVKKEIRVTNLGQALAGYGNVYVRLQLKEFMQIGGITYVETEQRYMIDEQGQFIVYPSRAEALSAWPGHSVSQLTDVVTGRTGWFIQTQLDDPNGQYGKHVLIDIVVGNATPVIPGSTFVPVDERNHHGYWKTDASGNRTEFVTRSGECDYPLHAWNYVGGLDKAPYIDEFIEWGLNTGSILRIGDWKAMGSPAIDKWILDDTATGGGWAYWGRPLCADGDTTANLLNTVKLIKQPEGNFYYVIHTDMEAASLDEFFKDGGNGWNKDVEDSYRNNAPSIQWQSEPPTEVEVNGTVASPAVKVLPAGARQDGLVWTSSNNSIATVDQNGVVTGKKPGKATITVRAENGATASYIIEVKAGQTPSVPATGVSINGGDRNMTVGQEDTLAITKTPATSTDTPAWSSDKSNVVSVDENGHIVAKAPGEANITVELRPGVTGTIKITVTAPVTEPDSIPTLKGEGPYEMQGNSDANLNYAVRVEINKSDFSGAYLAAPGSVKLSDILAPEFDYSGMTVSSPISSLVTIGPDKDNEDAIVIGYYGTQKEWADAYALPGRPNPQNVQMTLILHKDGYVDTTIRIKLAFNGSIYG